MSNSERSERAERTYSQYRDYLGEGGREIYHPPDFKSIEEVFPGYVKILDEYLFGDIMPRPELTFREREISIIAILVAVRFELGLKDHMNWCLNLGITREEVVEIIMYTAQYGGWPAGDEIFRIIGEAYPDFWETGDENPLEDIWSRPLLTLREKGIITLANLIAHRYSERLKAHMKYCLKIGISKKEILEIIMLVAHYRGWPVGVEAIRIAKEVFSSKEQ